MEHAVFWGAPRAVALTKSDTATIASQFAGSGGGAGPSFARRLFVGGAGNVAVTTTGGDVVTFTGVLANTYLDVECVLLMATGTTASAVVALYW